MSIKIPRSNDIKQRVQGSKARLDSEIYIREVLAYREYLKAGVLYKIPNEYRWGSKTKYLGDTPTFRYHNNEDESTKMTD